MNGLGAERKRMQPGYTSLQPALYNRSTLISKEHLIVHWGVQDGQNFGFRQAFSDFGRNARVMIE